MRKILKAISLVILIAITLFCSTIAIIFLVPTKSELDEKLLINTSDFASFYDYKNEALNLSKRTLSVFDDIPKNLKNAVVSSEDKNFYSHNGVDFLRIVKASLINLKNGNFSQGASTISQQLIKNTHLSQEKTLSRKITEIKLAQKLERKYSKDEILNMYLNTVYFGQNRYGIKDAAEYYFSKDIGELDLIECATLIGIIPSPAKYNPVIDIDLCKSKRNVVLSRMLKNGYIDEETYINACKSAIKLNITDENDYFSQYIAAATEEIYELTDLTPYDIAQAKIYTYLDKDRQKLCIDAKTENDLDYQAIVIDNATMGVSAYFSTCGQIQRSPASTIKPLLVYAPALEEGIIAEMTKIKDEPISLSGYSPQNYKNKYYGEVSVKFALSNSLNIPAVEVYNALGSDAGKSYLEKMQIYDENAALNAALGQFNEGITLKTLAQGYAVFANYGTFKPARFIKKITDKFGKVIFEPEDRGEKVFYEGTATIINDMLSECVKNGTAKKLNGNNYQLCAKTGTGGNENGNIDAYVCAYTTENTVICWSGYSDSGYMDNSVTGGSTPCVSTDHILKGLYSDHAPKDFEKKGVKVLRIDKSSYDEKGEFLLAEDDALEKDCYRFLFDDRFLPKEKVKTEAPEISEILVELTGQNVTFVLENKNEISVVVQKKTPFGIITIFDGVIGNFKDYYDEDTEYLITPYVIKNNKKIYGNTVEKTVIAQKKSSESIPDEWWKND